MLGVETIRQQKASEEFSKGRVIPRGSWWQWNSFKQRLKSPAPSGVVDAIPLLVWELIWELTSKLGCELIGTLMGNWFGGLLVG